MDIREIKGIFVIGGTFLLIIFFFLNLCLSSGSLQGQEVFSSLVNSTSPCNPVCTHLPRAKLHCRCWPPGLTRDWILVMGSLVLSGLSISPSALLTRGEVSCAEPWMSSLPVAQMRGAKAGKAKAFPGGRG